MIVVVAAFAVSDDHGGGGARGTIALLAIVSFCGSC